MIYGIVMVHLALAQALQCAVSLGSHSFKFIHSQAEVALGGSL